MLLRKFIGLTASNFIIFHWIYRTYFLNCCDKFRNWWPISEVISVGKFRLGLGLKYRIFLLTYVCKNCFLFSF